MHVSVNWGGHGNMVCAFCFGRGYVISAATTIATDCSACFGRGWVRFGRPPMTPNSIGTKAMSLADMPITWMPVPGYPHQWQPRGNYRRVYAKRAAEVWAREIKALFHVNPGTTPQKET